MNNLENINNLVKHYCASRKTTVKTTPELDQKIIHDALLRQKPIKTAPSRIGRIIMRSKTNQFVAAAAVVILIVVVSTEFNESTNGFSTVYAAAMDRVKQAGTFSCIEIYQASYRKDGKKGTYLSKQKHMFKEPDLERREKLTSPWPQYIGETSIRHYGLRQELTLRPSDKQAWLNDMQYEYTVDNHTGELKLTQLDTRLRDRLLRLYKGDVEDLGTVDLEGQTVRKLQSRLKNRVTTLWINPQTDYPIQIEQAWPNTNRKPVLFTSIQIDTELDDSLFSLEAPAGYTLEVEDPGYSHNQRKRMTKIMHLGKMCWVYATKHNNQFPSALENLVTTELLTQEALTRIRRAPDTPDTTAVIQYRQPNKDAEDRAIEVMLYEVLDLESVDDMVTVVMLDSHGELMPHRVLQQCLKPWPAKQKKVAMYMAYLYGYCHQYTQAHKGQFPDTLMDLVYGDITQERIKGFQTAWGQYDGSIQIQYRKPLQENDLSKEVLFHETAKQSVDDQAVVCFADGHSEIISD